MVPHRITQPSLISEWNVVSVTYMAMIDGHDVQKNYILQRRHIEVERAGRYQLVEYVLWGDII